MALTYTDNPHVAGQKRIHALQGGGEGLAGKYIQGLTWCGVEKRSKVTLVETCDTVTCKRCKDILEAFEARIGRRP